MWTARHKDRLSDNESIERETSLFSRLSGFHGRPSACLRRAGWHHGSAGDLCPSSCTQVFTSCFASRCPFCPEQGARVARHCTEVASSMMYGLLPSVLAPWLSFKIGASSLGWSCCGITHCAGNAAADSLVGLSLMRMWTSEKSLKVPLL